MLANGYFCSLFCWTIHYHAFDFMSMIMCYGLSEYAGETMVGYPLGLLTFQVEGMLSDRGMIVFLTFASVERDNSDIILTFVQGAPIVVMNTTIVCRDIEMHAHFVILPDMACQVMIWQTLYHGLAVKMAGNPTLKSY